MAIKKSLVGIKYGKITVIKFIGKQKDGHNLWECICECGNTITANQSRLIIGAIKSCGCHRIKHNASKTNIYNVWVLMRRRCNNPKSKGFSSYGGRGIAVCGEWNDSATFINWALNNGYKKGLQIDRINNDGNYSPENCQFITQKENTAIGKQRIRADNTSGYVGVRYSRTKEKWSATIGIDKKQKHIGYYNDLKSAVEARIASEIEHFGEQRMNKHYKNGDYHDN